jgi:hypothetical protein
MLMKDPCQRPTIDFVLSHPLLSGLQSPRMNGEEPKFDVFLSYRYDCDYFTAQKLFAMLTAVGFRVWYVLISDHIIVVTQTSSRWDDKYLETGESWETCFSEGLLQSRVYMPILSRFAINHPRDESQNFTQLKSDSPYDKLLLEYLYALELQSRGLLFKIYPVLLGDVVEVDSLGMTKREYVNYFNSQCHPTFSEDNKSTEVYSTTSKCAELLMKLGLGTPLLTEMTISRTLKKILENQGKVVVGSEATALDDIITDAEVMIRNLKFQSRKTSAKEVFDGYSNNGKHKKHKSSKRRKSGKGMRG